jgi:hypothetical protein
LQDADLASGANPVIPVPDRTRVLDYQADMVVGIGVPFDLLSPYLGNRSTLRVFFLSAGAPSCKHCMRIPRSPKKREIVIYG